MRKGSASQAMELCVQGPEGTAGEDEVAQEGQRDWKGQGPELTSANVDYRPRRRGCVGQYLGAVSRA